MQEAENLRFNISGGGARINSNLMNTTLKNVFDAIDEKVFDENIKKSLKVSASNYPFQALKSFILNLDRHIAKEMKKKLNNNKKNELEFPE